jgi:hypothetical protein
MDKDLLRALGYSDVAIARREEWEQRINDYFTGVKIKNPLESHYQVDFETGEIVFRDSCPLQIRQDIVIIFNGIIVKYPK